MAPLTGDEALAFHEALKRQNAEKRAEDLATARTEAAARGKEPFDLDALERQCDTSSEGRMDPVEVRRDRFEHMYYVEHPALTTLAELAQLIQRLNQW